VYYSFAVTPWFFVAGDLEYVKPPRSSGTGRTCGSGRHGGGARAFSICHSLMKKLDIQPHKMDEISTAGRHAVLFPYVQFLGASSQED